jgi:hypothetical protein
MPDVFIHDPDDTGIIYTIVWCDKDGTNDGSANDDGELQGETISTIAEVIPTGLTKVSSNKNSTTIRGTVYDISTVHNIVISGGTAGVKWISRLFSRFGRLSMWHIQRTVHGWTETLETLPDGAMVKATENYQIFREVKAANPNIFTVHRMVRDHWQRYWGNTSSPWFDTESARDMARAWFDAFIDGTFREQIEPYCDAVSWHNEIWANSQNAIEVDERIKASEAAVWVWDREYRPTFSHDVRLIIGEAAVGNNMPRRLAELTLISDNLLGYHPYEWWTNKQRSDEGWRAATSMRWDHMEFAWGLKPTWIFTENGPLESAVTGWRHSKCLGGDRNLYVESVRLWIQDVAKTPAYQEGRIKGFSLFTTFDKSDSSWGSFHTAQPELNMLADMIRVEWKPGTKPPEPPKPQPKRVRLTANTNIRLSPQYTGAAGAHNKLFTSPAGSEFVYRGETQGDSFRGSSLWYVIELDGGYLNGSAPVIAYCHSQLAELV